MRTKKLLFLLVMALFYLNNAQALIPSHGSILGKNLLVYDVAGAAPNSTPFPASEMNINYKLVTIGNKPYVWVQNTGSWSFSNANYGVQLRFWANPGDYTTSPITKSSGAQEYCFSGTSNRIPPTGSFRESIGFPGGWSQGGTGWSTNQNITFYFFTNRETNFIHYDKTLKNSAVVGDVTAPTTPTYTLGAIEETRATFTLSSSDANDYFYYISGNGIEYVSFKDEVTVSGLNASSNYSFQVTAVDFSGNESAPVTINLTTKGLYNVTSGETPDIRFVLKSTATVLEYYYEYKDPAKSFRDASLKITPSGGTQFEVKPTVSPDGKYCYGTTDNATIANKVLSLVIGYFQFEEPIDYNKWVVNIGECTVKGTTLPIMHQMGAPIASAEAETTNPVLNSASLMDVTNKYVKLNLNGSDNSGILYYEITGAKSTVHAFHTGDYYLTAIDPGHTYTLNIIPYDLSGNAGGPKTIGIKTSNARSNIAAGNTGVGYNNITPSTNPELVVGINQTGNSLTLSCTTASGLITNAGWKDRAFHTPTVKVDGVSFPLTLDAANTTATVTFDNIIDSKSIEPGVSFQIQWSVYWGVLGDGGGNFFTGTYTYVIGDNGQADTSGPTRPNLTLVGNNLTWGPSTDDLTGVKWYEITETGQAAVKIFDLGESSFAYTLVNPLAKVSVVAVDFANNASQVATVNDTGTSVGKVDKTIISIYPNPVVDVINISQTAKELTVYSLAGQQLMHANNTQTLNVSNLSGGMYLISITDLNNSKKTFKIQINK